MDPSLLKEREAFKKRAFANPVVENKKKKETSDASSLRDESSKKKSKAPQSQSNGSSASQRDPIASYKTAQGSSYKFGILTRIVQCLRDHHKDGDDTPMSLNDILDETNQLNVATKIQQWLLTEALPNNPKVENHPDNRFAFKPKYKIHDKKGLLRLLKQHDLRGLGGILLEDVMESIPNCEKVLKQLSNDIMYVVRPQDKKKVIFYNDTMGKFKIDTEFQKLWRAVGVDGVDDHKIVEYLEKQGIRSMQDPGVRKLQPPLKRKKLNQKRQRKRPRDNEHLADILETYDD